jgi:CDP-glucose 4,6-dehydratase
MAIINKNFWSGKRVLITGHTGFKGAWLSVLMNYLGVQLYGISLKPTKNSLFNKLDKKIFRKSYIFDLNLESKTQKIINKIKPEAIFHLASQSLVIKGYKYPAYTFKNNINSSVSLFNALSKNNFCKSLIVATTDKVYEINKNKSYREIDRLGSSDPYSSSKSCIEIITKSYFYSFLRYTKLSVATVRSGNVIGGGDWSENRIIPDAIKSWNKNKILIIRNPKFTRPWTHVLETLFGYIVTAEYISKKKNIFEIFNFGPSTNRSYNVMQVILKLKKYFNLKIRITKNRYDHIYKETDNLKLNTSKSKRLLKYKTQWNIEKIIKKTAFWYLSYYRSLKKNNFIANQLCIKDIIEYEKSLF